MNLKLLRKVFTKNSTVGELLIDGKFECFTLEDVVRSGPKVAGKTAIPLGRFELVLNFSNRFQRVLPQLLRVPGFEGIRIHPGNTAADTEGCILVGKGQGVDNITESQLAFGSLWEKLTEANKREKIWCDVAGSPNKPVA